MSEEWCVTRNYFFFSSRRRHTRLQGDWSSDVCSSDLSDGLLPFRPSKEDHLTACQIIPHAEMLHGNRVCSDCFFRHHVFQDVHKIFVATKDPNDQRRSAIL